MNQPAQSQTLANERNHHNATEVPLQAPQKDQFGIQWVGDFNQAIILEIKGIPRQAKSKKYANCFGLGTGQLSETRSKLRGLFGFVGK